MMMNRYNQDSEEEKNGIREREESLFLAFGCLDMIGSAPVPSFLKKESNETIEDDTFQLVNDSDNENLVHCDENE
jgi:hypothetical protein